MLFDIIMKFEIKIAMTYGLTGFGYRVDILRTAGRTDWTHAKVSFLKLQFCSIFLATKTHKYFE